VGSSLLPLPLPLPPLPLLEFDQELLELDPSWHLSDLLDLLDLLDLDPLLPPPELGAKLGDQDGNLVGGRSGLAVARPYEGNSVGPLLMVGVALPSNVGPEDGIFVGDFVGDGVDGATDGVSVGDFVGDEVDGATDGDATGAGVCFMEGD